MGTAMGTAYEGNENIRDSAFNQNAANMSADWDIAVRNMRTLVQKWNMRNLLGREGENPEQANPGEARVFWSDDPNPVAGGRSITSVYVIFPVQQ